MSFPRSATLETPILQELTAIGGEEDVRLLYAKLIPYCPQLSEIEIRQIKLGKQENWRKLIQRAGKDLDDKGLVTRLHGFWKITEKGRREMVAGLEDFIMTPIEQAELSHLEIQHMLVEIGKILGYHAQIEFEYYDVIWREKASHTRISHIFEVQSKGNIDSAFAKLKRAFDAQRSKPFLILSSERDSNRARMSLDREFQELSEVITILSFAEIKKVHSNLESIAKILPEFLNK